MKVIKNKNTKEVKFVYPDNAEIKVKKDSRGNSIIHIPNHPPPKTVIDPITGKKTIYLGGTVICDHEFVDNCIDIIKGVPNENVPTDIKEKKYKIDKTTKVFTPASEIGETS